MTRLPTVFIGSTVRSLGAVEYLSRALSDVAAVTPWNASELAKAGEHFLDSLLAAAPSFDFAILVFDKDDRVEIGKRMLRAPGDNVVFELGLFMGRLDRHRTLVVTPRPWKVHLRILTDLSNLNLVEYEPPRTRRRLRHALSKIVPQLRNRIAELGARSHHRAPVTVADLLAAVSRSLETAPTKTHTVLNIALDMESTWPYIRDRLLSENSSTRRVHWRSIMLDPASPIIGKLRSTTVSTTGARRIQQAIERTCSRLAAGYRARAVLFECRQYELLPPVHGVLIDKKTLFVTTCSIARGKLAAGNNPYFELTRPVRQDQDPASSHLFTVFESWFDHVWREERRVWPA